MVRALWPDFVQGSMDACIQNTGVLVLPSAAMEPADFSSLALASWSWLAMVSKVDRCVPVSSGDTGSGILQHLGILDAVYDSSEEPTVPL